MSNPATGRLETKFEIKSTDDSNGTFAGYASVFNVEDFDGDVVVAGAFADSIAAKGASGIKMLWQHDMDEPIGVFTEIREDAKGLYVEGRLLVDDDPLARRAYAHLKAGSLNGLSVGFRTILSERDTTNDVTILKELDLWEISLVTFPANNLARVAAVKSPRELERFLRDAGGFSRREAKAIVATGYTGLRDQRDVDDGSDELMRALKSLEEKLNG